MGLLELLLPPACAGCSRYGALLCEACAAELQPAASPADRFTTADPGIVVGDAVELAVAAFRHDGVARRALQRLKYGGAARLAPPLAARSLPALRCLQDMVDGDLLLVPVPVHADRRRQRGYNQAELLAVALAGGARLPLADLLVRVRPTLRQHGLGRAARLHNLRGAFVLRSPPPPLATVILVDDILTTAATLEACAEVLRAGGAKRVVGFAIAREV